MKKHKQNKIKKTRLVEQSISLKSIVSGKLVGKTLDIKNRTSQLSKEDQSHIKKYNNAIKRYIATSKKLKQNTKNSVEYKTLLKKKQQQKKLIINKMKDTFGVKYVKNELIYKKNKPLLELSKKYKTTTITKRFRNPRASIDIDISGTKVLEDYTNEQLKNILKEYNVLDYSDSWKGHHQDRWIKNVITALGLENIPIQDVIAKIDSLGVNNENHN